MEAVCSLKRVHQPDFEECLTCQERKTERLINGGERGFETLKHASQTRDKLLDTDNRPAIDRILTVILRYQSTVLAQVMFFIIHKQN